VYRRGTKRPEAVVDRRTLGRSTLVRTVEFVCRDAIVITSEGAPGDHPLVRLEAVEKVFRTGRLEYPAVRGVDLSINRGEFVAIVGPSGSGKSTILNLMTGIDHPTAGTVEIGGEDLGSMSEDDLAVWRARTVGIIFQFFQLLPTLTALENAALPLDFAPDTGTDDPFVVASSNLERVGLADKADHMPAELSGGEQQRVAIARALACSPPLLVGDEPTGNLDSATAADMLDLLDTINRDGVTVVYVTHDRELARRANRVVRVRDGLVVDGER
jgi:putative ABC transport system ATP-binding protein